METTDKADKKEYEISFLLKEERGAEEIVKLLKQHEAEITFEGPVRKLAFAYRINGESEGFFGYLHFRISPDKVPAFDKDLKTKSAVMRFLIITPPFTKMRVQPSARPKESPSTSPSSDRSPLSNEALEKKIEEILQ